MTAVRVSEYRFRRVMAGEVAKPHDHLFRSVFRDEAEAAGLLRANLPPVVTDAVIWSTLKRRDRSFVDGRLRGSESDLLFELRRGASPTARRHGCTSCWSTSRRPTTGCG